MNTGRACDFLPWLLELPWQHKEDVRQWSAGVREYVLDHFLDNNREVREKNLLSSLIKKVDVESKVSAVK